MTLPWNVEHGISAVNEIGGMRRRVTSFAAPTIVSLFRVSIDCCEIPVKHTSA
ncbi:hypothetical protein HanRHA438_Chr16g0785511 [Helianthus annuus]|nr:hypothetical protein HanRHA438_Chr16g0785511 [Helianthus annuus]